MPWPRIPLFSPCSALPIMALSPKNHDKRSFHSICGRRTGTVISLAGMFLYGSELWEHIAPCAQRADLGVVQNKCLSKTRSSRLFLSYSLIHTNVPLAQHESAFPMGIYLQRWQRCFRTQKDHKQTLSLQLLLIMRPKPIQVFKNVPPISRSGKLLRAVNSGAADREHVTLSGVNNSRHPQGNNKRDEPGETQALRKLSSSEW